LMRILFYLPVITPWWFDQIVVPMLRRLNDDVAVREVHVMVAPLWRNTGVDGAQLQPLVDLAKLRWHIVDEADPEIFRIAADRIDGLLDIVAGIAPDLILARSADFATPARFLAPVRYIMEAAAGPFVTDPTWVILEEQPFAYGAMPGDAALLEACVARTQALWQGALGGVTSPALVRQELGLPLDRPLLAVPLQYEHDENFYLLHAAFPDSVAMLTALLAALPEQVLLAVSDHPLNRLHVNRSRLEEFVAMRSSRIELVAADDATARLTLAADAVVTDLSKTWSLAAFAGKPLLHIGKHELAPWLRASGEIAAFGPAQPAPDPLGARQWFAWHLAARLLRPEAVDSALLLRHFADAPNMADLDANVAALEAIAP